MRKKEKIYQLGDYYSIQYQILRTNIIRIVLQMRRVNVNRPLFTRSSSSSFPILLSTYNFVADTVLMNGGPVLFIFRFVTWCLPQWLSFAQLTCMLLWQTKKKQLHRDDGLKLLIFIHKFCICGMVQYLYTVTLIDLVCMIFFLSS